jgi:hypothetical protein
MKQFPIVDSELLAALVEKFPDRCPDVSTPVDEVRARAGEQRVIRFLARVFDDQNENILTREVIE